MSQYIPDLTERFPEGFGGVDLTDRWFPSERGYDDYECYDDREAYEDENCNADDNKFTVIATKGSEKLRFETKGATETNEKVKEYYKQGYHVEAYDHSYKVF